MEVPWKVSEAFARIAREAVTNASRHGQAQRVRIAVSNGNGIALVVHDDGIGFDPVRCADKGYGLRTMRERAESLGGGMSIRSLPGRGTRVEVVLP
jgi:signal transduction histidine kinase